MGGGVTPLEPSSAAASTSESRSTKTTRASKRLATSFAHSRTPRPETLSTSSSEKAAVKKMETCSSASTSDWGMSYQTTHMSSVLSRISIGKRMPNQRMSISRRHACPHADEGGPSQSRCAFGAFDSSSAIGAPAATGTTGTSAPPPAVAPADESDARLEAAPPLDAASSAASARSSAASSAASLATSATSANV